jgi:hypothetical protein
MTKGCLVANLRSEPPQPGRQADLIRGVGFFLALQAEEMFAFPQKAELQFPEYLPF